MNHLTIMAYLLIGLFIVKCSKKEVNTGDVPCHEQNFRYLSDQGCDGQVYGHPDSSEYILPFPEGTTIRMGLSNCSLSFHGSGQPDQYAYDFDFPEGTPFIASRGGKVVKVVEDQSSDGGGAGNYLVIDHGDSSYGLYYHSPFNGVSVEVDEVVEQGQELGFVGRSGLAGYPHLHFIVVSEQYNYPYQGIAINFNNVNPKTTVLQSYTEYSVCQ